MYWGKADQPKVYDFRIARHMMISLAPYNEWRMKSWFFNLTYGNLSDEIQDCCFQLWECYVISFNVTVTHNDTPGIHCWYMGSSDVIRQCLGSHIISSFSEALLPFSVRSIFFSSKCLTCSSFQQIGVVALNKWQCPEVWMKVIPISCQTNRLRWAQVTLDRVEGRKVFLQGGGENLGWSDSPWCRRFFFGADWQLFLLTMFVTWEFLVWKWCVFFCQSLYT